VEQLKSVPKGTCRWRRRKEERPAEILCAALKMFTSKGFSSTKLDEVAREAGVSKGTLYLYFESKESLFKAVVTEFVLPQIANAEEQAEKNTGAIKDLLILLIEQWRKNVLETDLAGIAKMMIAEASNFPDLATFYLENVIKRTRYFVANLITIGIKRGEFVECDANYTARILLTPILFSAVWQHSLAPFDDRYDIEKYLNIHLDIFFRGILKESQE